MKATLRRTTVIVFSFLMMLSLFPRTHVNAYDFVTDVGLLYSVDEKGVMHIKETRTVTNNSTKYLLKGSSSETFIISSFKTRSKDIEKDLQMIMDTVKLTDTYGNQLSPEMEIVGSSIEVKVLFGNNLNSGDSKRFILEYDNYELAEKSGNVWNIYIPGMSEEFESVEKGETGATSRTNFSVTLEVADSIGQPSFVLPDNFTKMKKNDVTVYIFDPDALIEQSVWIQIGNKQYYDFTIRQPVRTTQNLGGKVFNTFYDLVLPRSSESGNQEVFFKSFQPEPQYVKQDDEGNVIARFSFSSSDSTDIVVEGFVTTSATNEVTKGNVGNIGDISLDKAYAEIEDVTYTYGDLLKEATFWEVNEEEIKQTANDLKADLENVYDIVLEDYHFIIENVDYDTLKIGLNNQRQGALKTLEGGSSVCMEYSDLLITLLRAQGIPARAAFGYGFDPRSEGVNEEGHQWVEVYMPGVGWVPVDPTWGDTGRRNYIGGDVDHALWRITSKDVDIPSSITKYSILDDEILDPPVFIIEPVERIDTENIQTLDNLLSKYPYTPKHQIQERVDQLNTYGKLIFIGIPAVLLLFFIISLVSFVMRGIQRKMAEPRVVAGPASHSAPGNNPYY